MGEASSSSAASFSTNGTYALRLSASDSVLSASDTVIVTVNSPGTGPTVFRNPAAVAIADVGAGSPYPSTLTVSGRYRPTNLRSGDRFPAPAPGGPYGSALSAFVGLSPNGVWSLYVHDDGQGDQGLMGGGWSLTISTVEGAGLAVTNPPVADEPPASTATLSMVGRTEGSAATLQVRGLPWQKYVIEASEDLVSWTPLGVVCEATGVGYFVNSEAVRHARRFYRAMENP